MRTSRWDGVGRRRPRGIRPGPDGVASRRTMEFRILGPLEVRSDAARSRWEAVKPRAVLAVLLLHANEPVSAERLALALWGEDAPGRRR